MHGSKPCCPNVQFSNCTYDRDAFATLSAMVRGEDFVVDLKTYETAPQDVFENFMHVLAAYTLDHFGEIFTGNWFQSSRALRSMSVMDMYIYARALTDETHLVDDMRAGGMRHPAHYTQWIQYLIRTSGEHFITVSPRLLDTVEETGDSDCWPADGKDFAYSDEIFIVRKGTGYATRFLYSSSTLSRAFSAYPSPTDFCGPTGLRIRESVLFLRTCSMDWKYMKLILMRVSKFATRPVENEFAGIPYFCDLPWWRRIPPIAAEFDPGP